ncbi:MAG: hypothetical protein IPO83_11240 [Chitinophagaceae bacterium]|nr:hypothetical protein [Chitinophagaceae bacterium]
MSVLSQLASSLDRRDEEPNIELGKKIAAVADRNAVKELVSCLHHKNKNIRHDCIKVLYEIGERNPPLLVPYFSEFIALLETGNSRMLWGAMTALDYMALEVPDAMYKALSKIETAAGKDSVIARDHAVGIMAKLSSIGKYEAQSFRLLIRELQSCPLNQLPMYAEKTLETISKKNKPEFRKTLNERLTEIKKDSQRKRLMKVLDQL